MSIEVKGWELHNCEVEGQSLRVRQGWRNIATGLNAVYGFSVESANTTEVWHYLIERNQTGDGYISVRDEKLSTEILSFNLGKIPEDCPVYWGVQNRQILINSPAFNFPVYGIVGGGLKRATKTTSVNPQTTALDIPTGILCVFGDRFCIAQGSILYFNDPGTDPRTFVAENTIPLPSTVYHLEQTDDGFLAAFCASGIYLLPRDALGRGQAVEGFISTIPGYEAADYRCAASGNGITVGLVRDGLSVLQQQMALLPIQGFHQKRYFTDYVRPDDFRFGKVHKTHKGFLVSYPRASLVIDIQAGYSSWHYNTSESPIRAVLHTREGRDLYLLADRVVFPFGTADDLDGYVQGFAAGQVPSGPQQSPVLREVWTSSDNNGLAQSCYARGRGARASTAFTGQIGQIIGTSTWSASGTMGDRELRNVRHQFAVRTDDICLEVGAQGAGRLIGPIDVVAKGQGSGRPD